MWPAEIVGDVTAAIERLGEPAAKFFARHPGGERRAFQFFNYGWRVRIRTLEHDGGDVGGGITDAIRCT